MSRILNFSDQDSSRDAVLRICSKFTVESIAAIDSAIGIEVDEDSTEAESYKEFLAWLGPHLCQMAQSHVVGPLLSSITYEGEGVISVSSDLPAIELHRDELYTRRGRVGWLVEEIPSLIEHYGQLYEDEVPQALRDCERAAEIDWSADNALTANAELFESLETWYLFSQPGYRVYRGDEEAQEQARKQIEKAKEFVREDTRKKNELQKKIDEGIVEGETSKDALVRLNEEIDALDAKVSGFEKSIGELLSHRNRLLDELERIEDLVHES